MYAMMTKISSVMRGGVMRANGKTIRNTSRPHSRISAIPPPMTKASCNTVAAMSNCIAWIRPLKNCPSRQAKKKPSVLMMLRRSSL